MTRLPRLWLCADLELFPPAALAERVASALAAGPALVWLRSPASARARTVLDAAERLRASTARRGVPLLVGDRVDVALAVGADGAHLTERSLAPSDVRRLWPGGYLSRSVHDASGVRDHAPSVDALVVAPFGLVPGKAPALGAEGLARLRALAPGTSVVALGGIDGPEALRAAFAAGADAVAVRRVLGADDPARRCAALFSAMP